MELPILQFKDGKKDFDLYILDLIYYSVKNDKSYDWLHSAVIISFAEHGIHLGSSFVHYMIKDSVALYRKNLKGKG